MRVATILPIPFLPLVGSDDYHMCLAHLLHHRAYRDFFVAQAQMGHFVLMDNGVVETGFAKPTAELFALADAVHPTQVCLPDSINDRRATLALFRSAVSQWDKSTGFETMAIPQGETLEEWISCASHMLRAAEVTDGVTAMGITKFLEGKVACRADAIENVPGLVDSDLDLHLLGVLGSDPTEIWRTEQRLPGRIRGCDSGIAAIYTQAGLVLGEAPRPRVDLDFDPPMDVRVQRAGEGGPVGFWRADRLATNLRRWKAVVARGAYE